MALKDITKKITRIFFSSLFIFSMSFFVLPTDDVLAVCTKVNPTVEFIPIMGGDTVSGEIGTAFNYTIRVTNNDIDDGFVPLCSPIAIYDFSITPIAIGSDLESHTLPSTVNMNTGASANTLFTVTSKATGLSSGNYAFTITATDKSDATKTASTNGIYQIICTERDPIVTIAPNSLSGLQGQDQTYALSVKNDDSASCANRTFVLLLSGLPACLPEGWADDLEVNTGSLAGQSPSYIKNVIISSCLIIANGTYTFTVTATEGANSGNDTADYVVTSPVGEDCATPGDEDANGFADCDDLACLGTGGCCGNGIKELIEICDTDADCGPNEACSGCSSCVSTIRTNQCPIGFDDCDCNASTGVDGCEMEVSSDSSNCGGCGINCYSGKCINGACLTVTGGIVPCGRIADNPDTLWNEQESCKICHAIPLVKSIIDYLVGIVGLIAILSMVISGLFSITSLGNANTLNMAKTAVSKSLYGLVFVFIAWIIVNTGMVVFGFNDPDGDGRWEKISCDLITTSIGEYCGDGLVQNPNSDGINEVCDPKETLATYQLRTGNTPQEWVEDIYACDPIACSYSCVSDTILSPVYNDIGEGCYDPLGIEPCQKGKFVCDTDPTSATFDTVVCRNTFNDPIYRLSGDMCQDVFDYCCDNNSSELADGKIGNAPFLIVKAAMSDLQFGPATGTLTYANLTTGLWGGSVTYADWGPGVGFKCDDVCKNVGKVCIGVGLTNPAADACIYMQHDTGGVGTVGCNNDNSPVISMALPENQATSNCDAWFAPFYYSNQGGSGQHYSTGYDKYEYHCVNNGLDSYLRIFAPNSIYAGFIGGFNAAPVGSEGTCMPSSPDTCEFHGFDLAETACYCL